ncbi:hypothetical protein D9757_008292 [Collybiopsis confluens]|uniref:RRM domain-containing protein n=1 Tax=Collybiopsis confluens TaxID=2823264 RepID=A0A8H5H4M4_9AGAR|nr:hypothetical protein D9757_008292 [Collybiopsis confluens]
MLIAFFCPLPSVCSPLCIALAALLVISGKMFIGGLHWDTTDEGLRAYFEQYGEVDACTIMRDPSGRSRCFAFLTFVDAASVNAVMVKEHVLDGKIIDPKRAVPREEHQRATKLFIGGLAGTVTSESLRTFFSQYGKVIDSTVMIDRETGRSKGFAFLSIENANVQQWLGFGHLEIDGKLIDVKLAQPRFQRESPQHDQQSASSYSNQNLGETRGPRSEFQGGNAPGGNFNGVVGNAAFDPQALASLYQRMFQMANGAMNPMMGGVNPMMMMRGMQTMNGGAGGNMETNGLPRGPRNPPGAMGAGVGPSRQQRGQHNYHPYGR